MLGIRLGDGSNAPSLSKNLNLDGSPIPLSSTAAHDPIVVKKLLWMRRNSPNKTMKTYEMIRMKIWGETVLRLRVLLI